MTRQYLIGELSSMLGELQEEVTSTASAPAVARLRREVETAPVTALGSPATRALELIDRLRRESLHQGDNATSTRLAAIGSELRVFGVCAGLFDAPPRVWRAADDTVPPAEVPSPVGDAHTSNGSHQHSPPHFHPEVKPWQ